MTYAPYIIIGAFIGAICLFGVALLLENAYQRRKK